MENGRGCLDNFKNTYHENYLMNKKTIIFDVDGTIADTFEKLVDIIYKNVKKYTDHNLTKKQIRIDLRSKSLKDIIEGYGKP